MNKDFFSELIAGILLGLILVGVMFAFWYGMKKEIDRQILLHAYYCETYGACADDK